MELAGKVHEKLQRFSATISDRLLRNEERKLRIKGRSPVIAVSSLIHRMPIYTIDEWDVKEPGYVQVVPVNRDGGSWREEIALSVSSLGLPARASNRTAAGRRAPAKHSGNLEAAFLSLLAGTAAVRPDLPHFLTPPDSATQGVRFRTAAV